MKIKIADLDLSLQTRAGTDVDTINNYAEAMADGASFPDVTVFTDGKHYWLADGFHRVMAAKQNGKTTVAADVRKGTEDDAVVFGGTANNKQGKRPTRADVQHFLSMVWERREAVFGGTPTGGNLAEKCGVSRATGERLVMERPSVLRRQRHSRRCRRDPRTAWERTAGRTPSGRRRQRRRRRRRNPPRRWPRPLPRPSVLLYQRYSRRHRRGRRGRCRRTGTGL